MRSILFFFLFFSLSSQASNVLTLAVDDSPPYSYRNAENQLDGLSVKIAERFAAQLNMELKPVFCPWARCLELVKRGSLDLILGVNKDAEREQWLDFIEPAFFVGEQKFGFFVLSQGPKIQRYQDLKGLSIGSLRGSYHFPRFDADNKLYKVTTTNVETLINMLIAGNLDTVIHLERTMAPYLEQFDKQNQMKLSDFKPTVTTNGFLAISKKSNLSKDLDSLNDAMKTLVRSGAIVDLFNAYNVETTEQMRQAVSR